MFFRKKLTSSELGILAIDGVVCQILEREQAAEIHCSLSIDEDIKIDKRKLLIFDISLTRLLVIGFFQDYFDKNPIKLESFNQSYILRAKDKFIGVSFKDEEEFLKDISDADLNYVKYDIGLDIDDSENMNTDKQLEFDSARINYKIGKIQMLNDLVKLSLKKFKIV